MTATGDSTCRVLIIDGDSVRRGMLACTLPASSFSLEFARTADSGLDLLARVQPDVVIVGHDACARALCRRVRSTPAGTTCILVLMDEQFRDEIAGGSEAEAAGADAFLPFPFEVDLLFERLRAVLGRRKTDARRASAAGPPPLISDDSASEAAPSPSEDGPAEWERFRARVRWLHDSLDALDYYQLLQISEAASASEIKDAYFRCAMEFHPDRFVQLPEQELRLEIYEVYKRMSEAFKILFNHDTRSDYDAGLRSGDRLAHLRYVRCGRRIEDAPEDPTTDAGTPGGKKYLRFAHVAEAEGRLRSARTYLTLALQSEPDNPALRSRLETITRRLS
jgi:CheY-like chemotaxis protein